MFREWKQLWMNRNNYETMIYKSEDHQVNQESDTIGIVVKEDSESPNITSVTEALPTGSQFEGEVKLNLICFLYPEHSFQYLIDVHIITEQIKI